MFSPTAPSWDGACGFHHHVKSDYSDFPGDVKFRTQAITINAGIGTHMDAPSHCIEGGKCVADLSLSELITSCIVIDISDRAHEQYSLSPEDIQNFEAIHGKIPKDSFVIVHTGWEQFWNEPKKYRNELVFPSVSKNAAELLLERNIAGLGIDTMSPDRADVDFIVHQILLGAGKYIVENITNAKQLPPTGSYSFALPMKGMDLTEAPIRLLGMINHN
jgi:kynurenine formamidase